MANHPHLHAWITLCSCRREFTNLHMHAHACPDLALSTAWRTNKVGVWRLRRSSTGCYNAMEGAQKPPPMTFLLPNLTQTNALPLLPLPEIPPDSEAQTPRGIIEQLDDLSRDEGIVLQLQGLLSLTDITSMYAPARYSHNARGLPGVDCTDARLPCAANSVVVHPTSKAAPEPTWNRPCFRGIQTSSPMVCHHGQLVLAQLPSHVHLDDSVSS